MRKALFLFLVLAVPAQAQEKSVVTFPATAPAMGRPATLRPGELYVIRSSIKCRIEDSPEGVVKIVQKKGPLFTFAKFSDSGDKFEDRTFTEEFIWLVMPLSKGKCQILVMPQDLPTIRKDIVVDMAPGPEPPIPPDPVPPDPMPKVDAGYVLFIYESSELNKLPGKQIAAIKSTALPEYMDSKGVKYRYFDKDADLGNAAEVWRRAMGVNRTVKDAKGVDREVLPWVVVVGKDGSSVIHSGPFPDDLPGIMALLKAKVEK